ncbi:unnamed protein product [Phytophthora fragariaefolia]|uniref:Unnamed protein product n=1 Tax=Phytophthora fragariaefolia TaxID=1490495 RepID=A0A9W6WYG0_9STRA|nr:unnamed protein product [Phytophthora fragariaefolia]
MSNDGEDICVDTIETEQERCASLGGGERNIETKKKLEKRVSTNGSRVLAKKRSPTENSPRKCCCCQASAWGGGQSRNSTDESE